MVIHNKGMSNHSCQLPQTDLPLPFDFDKKCLSIYFRLSEHSRDNSIITYSKPWPIDLPGRSTEGTILLMLDSRNHLLRWLVLALLLALFVVVVFLAPLEKTLGETIRLVYVHAAFTRAGMIGFYICGLLGLIISVTNNAKIQSWTQTAAWVSFALFVLGGIFSVFAQQASWGGVPLAEPRVRMSMTMTAVIVIILLVNEWIPWIRLRGLLYVAIAGYIAWVLPRTPLVLHPENAAGSSPSTWIRLAFPLLTALALALGLWFVMYLKRPEKI